MLSVTGGSGGVGKTFLVANLAAALVLHGERVLVFDADLTLANLPTVLGLAPGRTLHHVLAGTATLDETIVPVPGGFPVVLAGTGTIESAHLAPELHGRLAAVLAELAARYDRILVHTGAGVSDVVQHAVSLAEEAIVVVTADATAMTEAYGAIKMLALCQHHTRLQLVANRAAHTGEAEAIGRQLQRVVDRFVSPAADAPVTLECLGEVPADPAVRASLKQRRLLLESSPHSPAARAICDIAQRLAG